MSGAQGASPARGPARGPSFEAMAVALLFIAVAFAACLTVAQSDTYWSLRAGQDIWRTHHVPLVDTYSYTAAGGPWPNHEWLWQATAYPLYRVGGFPLLTAAAAAALVAAVALVYRTSVGAVSTRFVLLLLAIPLSSIAWTLRPQIATLLGLATLLWLLARDRHAWLPLLFLVWANVHGGVALGGAVLVAAALAAAVRARGRFAMPEERRRARRLRFALPLCALATCATPLGFGIFRFVVESEARLRAVHVNEWMPFSFGPVITGAFAALAGAFVVLLLLRWGRLRAGTWADWVAVAAVLVLAPFAARSARHACAWLLLAPVAASRLLGPDFRFRRAPRPASADHPALNALIVGVVAAAALGSVAWLWSVPLRRLGWRPVPAGALAALRACPGPLYNHYNDGGYLIWLAPERKVFIDNRQDPYPLALLLEHAEVERGPASVRPAPHAVGRPVRVPAGDVTHRPGARGRGLAFRFQRRGLVGPGRGALVSDVGASDAFKAPS